MASITKTYSSDDKLSNVDCRLYSAGGKFYAAVQITFGGGRKSITKTVDLAALTKTQRDAGLLFFGGVYDLGLAAVTEDDF